MICPNCGAQVQEGASFCASCGTSIPARPIRQQPVTIATEQAKQENLGKGLIGALIGAVIGGAAIFLLGKQGLISALAGFVLAFLTYFLYEKMAGGISKKGVILCTVLIAVVPFLAHHLIWASHYVETFEGIFSDYRMDSVMGIRLINQTYGTSIQENSLFEILGSLDSFLEVDGIKEDFTSDLFKLYGFTALGAAATVWGMFKKSKK